VSLSLTLKAAQINNTALNKHNLND